MDIEDLYTLDDHEGGAEMQVVNPLTGRKLECFIILKGRDSRTYRDAKMQGERSAIKQMADGGEINSAEVVADTLAKITIGWRGFTSRGKDLPFSQAAVKQLYLSSPNIADQADTFMASRVNFIKG